jgi:folate-binding Fe-S cluster repair protein YgfZ
LIKVGGEDRLRFLHNQATNAFDTAAPNSVLPASFVTSTGRMLDYVRVLVLEAEAHILCSPTLSSVLLKRFEKYIFPLDRVRTVLCSLQQR